MSRKSKYGNMPSNPRLTATVRGDSGTYKVLGVNWYEHKVLLDRTISNEWISIDKVAIRESLPEDVAVFSFSADTREDVRQFQSALKKADLVFEIEIIPNETHTGFYVELLADVTLDGLRNIMRNLINGEFMLQTLRQCSFEENSFERDS